MANYEDWNGDKKHIRYKSWKETKPKAHYAVTLNVTYVSSLGWTLFRELKRFHHQNFYHGFDLWIFYYWAIKQLPRYVLQKSFCKIHRETPEMDSFYTKVYRPLSTALPT